MASKRLYRALKTKIFKGQFYERFVAIFTWRWGIILWHRRMVSEGVLINGAPCFFMLSKTALRRRNEVWKRKNPFSANPQFWVFVAKSCNERKIPLVTARNFALSVFYFNGPRIGDGIPSRITTIFLSRFSRRWFSASPNLDSLILCSPTLGGNCIFSAGA